MKLTYEQKLKAYKDYDANSEFKDTGNFFIVTFPNVIELFDAPTNNSINDQIIHLDFQYYEL